MSRTCRRASAQNFAEFAQNLEMCRSFFGKSYIFDIFTYFLRVLTSFMWPFKSNVLSAQEHLHRDSSLPWHWFLPLTLSTLTCLGWPGYSWQWAPPPASPHRLPWAQELSAGHSAGQELPWGVRPQIEPKIKCVLRQELSAKVVATNFLMFRSEGEYIFFFEEQ